MIFVFILLAAILTLVVVFVAIHVIQPERLSLGVRSKWGTVGLDVERPSYLKAGRPPEPDDDAALPEP